ncbi:DivIVA domain-containing protein [Phycicoccus duodecadis]|uniref:Cell wall synthesis protein Wag31 n=1 Tax=Phycicoccus duodecadis TaxID=173053 RepID=A0A2N3YLA9_9MICO|nr:DivIVA domain-containing protein [Phycicoccus duodecadis]PKW27651.1 DivIVA domain-containing protein [Phycicoccus duodecadis]
MLTPEDVLNSHFTTTQLREGYDEREVDDFLDAVVASMRHHDGIPAGRKQRLVTAADVRAARFTTTRLRRGYEMSDVDALMDRVAAALDALESGRGATPTVGTGSGRAVPAVPGATEPLGRRLLRVLRGEPRG